MGKNWAIAIGIDYYDNFKALQYARQDALAMRDFWRELDFEQVYFFAKDAPRIAADLGSSLPAEPTYARVNNFLDRRLKHSWLQPGDNFWFFFSGHGKRQDQRDYLMLEDSNPDNVVGSALAIQDLTSRLQNSGAGNIILLLDACRDDPSKGGLGVGLAQPGIITFYSCRAEQESFEIAELGGGAFTYALLQGLRLRGEAGNCATVDRLYAHLRMQVPYLVERYKQRGQDPVLALDPDSKRDAILLPTQARPTDVLALKNHALEAEAKGNYDVARSLWLQVVNASPADNQAAFVAIDRMARGDTTRTPAVGTVTSRSARPRTRRYVLQWLLGSGLGLTSAAWLPLLIEQWKSRWLVAKLNSVASFSSELPPVPSPVKPSPTPTKSPSPPAKSPPKPTLEKFMFETVQLKPDGPIAKREKLEGKRFVLTLAAGGELAMVAIAGGKFMMGSPETEVGRDQNESPQHDVTIPAFLMAQTPVTQAQWRAIAATPKIKIHLAPDPSEFKGNQRPVENVSWWEAVEFCDRLSQQTGQTYRLPSEAEWEYACRAGTKTPFHFGETLTTDVANYNGNEVYGAEPIGKDREQTTNVRSFPANARGLYDLHGNVSEWCADHWYDDYQNAPKDGKAWLTSQKDESRLLRGGAWLDMPISCRAANRNWSAPTNRSNLIGFRVVCVS